MTRNIAAAVVLALVSWATPARAQDGGFFDRWYGWQLALADTAAAALVLAPIDAEARGATVGVGMTALFMNGSIVNMANGNPKRASLSLIRLPAFLTGRLIGFGTGHLLCKQTGCKGPIQTWAGAVALAGAVAFDWATAARPPANPWASREPSDPDAAPARLDGLAASAASPPPRGRPVLLWRPALPIAGGTF